MENVINVLANMERVAGLAVDKDGTDVPGPIEAAIKSNFTGRRPRPAAVAMVRLNSTTVAPRAA